MSNGGYLYKRGETWWGRVRCAGREHRSSLRTASRKEARARLKEWAGQISRQAVLGDSGQHSWQEAVVKWAEEVLPKSVKPAVATRYLCSIGQLEGTFGGLTIEAITVRHVAEYVSARAAAASNATIRRDLSALSRLLTACLSWGSRPDGINPAAIYDRGIIPERREPIDPPTDAEIAALIALAPTGMARILTLLNETGMREAEAVGLEASNIDHAASKSASSTLRPTGPGPSNGGRREAMPARSWPWGHSGAHCSSPSPGSHTATSRPISAKSSGGS